MSVWKRSVRSFVATGMFAGIGATITGCQHPAATDSRGQDEKTVRDLDARWSQVAGAKDLDATLAFYADHAILLPPDEPVSTDAADIRKSWAGTFATFDAIEWHVKTLEVAKAGDLAYETGAWKGTIKAPNGQVQPLTGKLVSIWKKGDDGNWKCVVDTFNSDAPTTAPVSSAQ